MKVLELQEQLKILFQEFKEREKSIDLIIKEFEVLLHQFQQHAAVDQNTLEYVKLKFLKTIKKNELMKTMDDEIEKAMMINLELKLSLGLD